MPNSKDKKINNPQINERIVMTRHALKLSQAKFAEKIKISTSYMGSIEMGIRRVNDRIIKIISMTFGINENWLKSGQGKMFDDIEDFKLNQLVSIFKKLDPSFQDYVIKQLDMLLELQGLKVIKRSGKST
jgi:transcriptional regulator with XRE-family HTH domain